MTESEGPRRDPRRLFTDAQRTRIASRQHRQCSECGNDLPDIFHIHHVIPWALGGLTEEDNGVAVCPDCHLRAEIKQLDSRAPRDWQREAAPEVLPLLRRHEFATVSAAPGAGKTWFSAWIYRQLADMGDVARIVIFVPNTHLRKQWQSEVKSLNVFLQTKGTTEGKSYDGVVLTYHSLSDARQVEQIIKDAEEQPTLFILDEVHHLAKSPGGNAGSWAVSIRRIVGSVERPLHSVLSLSGTLFRSVATEQITTIRYVQLEDGRIETVADYTVKASRLVHEKQLRHVKVLGFDAEMRVEAVDIAKEASSIVSAVDIDDNKKLGAPLLAGMIRDPRFLKGIIRETISRLGHASTALEGSPVKGLIIADNVDHADQVYSELIAEVGARFAFIAHGEMASAEAEIERFRELNGQGILVAVQKVSEGFDVPDICVLTYLRTWRAQLFINQLTARAMRVTEREKQLEFLLPATIIIPNVTGMKAAFANVLAGPMDLKLPPEACGKCGRELCACPPWPKSKICERCEFPWYLCICPCRQCGRTKATGCRCRLIRDGRPDLDMEVVSDGEVVHVSVDGREVNIHIIETLRESLRDGGIPEVHIEQAAARMQERLDSDPMTFLMYLRRDDNDAA
jgi:superfamily II DNA or RNA helicase